MDQYKNVTILSRMISDDGVEPWHKYSFAEILPLRDGIERLITQDAAEKKEKLFERLAKEAATKRDDDFNPPNNYFIGQVQAVQEMPEDDIPTFYKQYLKGHTEYNQEDIFEEFWENVIEATYLKDSNLLRQMPRAYNAAMIGSSLLASDNHAFFRYATANSSSEDRKKWREWPEREKWFISGGSTASYVHLIGPAGSGKTKIQQENIDIALSKGCWVRTNMPVKDSKEKNLYFVTKFSHLLDGEHGPTIFEFMSWREEVKKIFPAAEPSFMLIIDEKPKEKSAEIQMDNKEAAVRVRRHYHMPILETSTDRSQPKVENKVTAFGTLTVEGKEVGRETHYLDYQKDPSGGGGFERIAIEEPREPSFQLHFTSQDEAPPFIWDINFDKLKELIGDDEDIRDLDWKSYDEKAREMVPILTGEFDLSELEEKKPAVAVCPYCGTEQPYRRKASDSVKCNNHECGKIFLVNPEEQYNWHIVDQEYEQKKRLELEEEKQKKEQAAQEDEAKQKKPGVSVCPYCAYEDEFRKAYRDTVRCGSTDCRKIYIADPTTGLNWHLVDEAYMQRQMDLIEQEKNRSAEPEDPFDDLDHLIINTWPEIRAQGKHGITWFCKSHRINRKKPNRETVRRRIQQLQKMGECATDMEDPETEKSQPSKKSSTKKGKKS